MTTISQDRPLLVTDDTDWQQLLAWLPSDLDATARQTGAYAPGLHVPSAAALLRLAFAYVLGPSLRAVSRWAQLAGVATLSHVALDTRLRRLGPWLAVLIGQHLAAGTAWASAPARRVVLVDATTAERPGATGTDWRLHVALDLATLRLTDVCVTGPDVGERFGGWPWEPGDLLLGDMTYGTRAGVDAVVQRQADVLVRVTWQNFPVTDAATGARCDLLALARTVAPDTVGQWDVQTVPTRQTPACAGRLVIAALPAASAARARERKRRAGGTAATLEAAGYVFLFTTLPAAVLAAADVAALYRARWQIECAFKRLKHLLPIARIRARTDALCLTTLLAAVLLALLLETLGAHVEAFSPSDLGAPHLRAAQSAGSRAGQPAPGHLRRAPRGRVVDPARRDDPRPLYHQPPAARLATGRTDPLIGEDTGGNLA